MDKAYFGLLVFGSRGITDYARFKRTLETLGLLERVTVVYTGDARGVDSMARTWGQTRRDPPVIMAADWKNHGRGAGHRRNAELAKRFATDFPDPTTRAALVVWDGESPGTAGMIVQCHKRNIRLYIWRPGGDGVDDLTEHLPEPEPCRRARAEKTLHRSPPDPRPPHPADVSGLEARLNPQTSCLMLSFPCEDDADDPGGLPAFNSLICPVCEDFYAHYQEARPIRQDEPPSTGRSSVMLVYDCEQGHRYGLCFHFHKGNVTTFHRDLSHELEDQGDPRPSSTEPCFVEEVWVP